MNPGHDAAEHDRRPPPPIPAAEIGGGPCGWEYCQKWGSVVVEHGQGGDYDRIWVCLTHAVHAHVRGWREVWPTPR